MDVSSAYLTATLKETTRMFIKPPPGCTGSPGYGLRLLKALYGTGQQGGNRWATHRDDELAKLGLTLSADDPFLSTLGTTQMAYPSSGES